MSLILTLILSLQSERRWLREARVQRPNRNKTQNGQILGLRGKQEQHTKDLHRELGGGIAKGPHLAPGLAVFPDQVWEKRKPGTWDLRGNLSHFQTIWIQVALKKQFYFTHLISRYYFDSLKIHTESDNFQVPIHAFPVLNRENIRDVFPKLIDFGIVEIGEQEKQVSLFFFPLLTHPRFSLWFAKFLWISSSNSLSWRSTLTSTFTPARG